MGFKKTLLLSSLLVTALPSFASAQCDAATIEGLTWGLARDQITGYEVEDATGNSSISFKEIKVIQNDFSNSCECMDAARTINKERVGDGEEAYPIVLESSAELPSGLQVRDFILRCYSFDVDLES